MAKLWLFGVLAEAGVLATLYAIGAYQRRLTPNSATVSEPGSLAAAKGQPPLGPAAKDSVFGAIADSLGLKIEQVNGRTVVHGSPESERRFQRMVTGIGEGI